MKLADLIARLKRIAHTNEDEFVFEIVAEPNAQYTAVTLHLNVAESADDHSFFCCPVIFVANNLEVECHEKDLKDACKNWHYKLVD